jgi:two-component system chemotaxis response regulator CheY
MSATYKVLIVEDEQLVRRMFQKTLERDPQFEVQLASNGEEGLLKMRSWHPDIVVMDVMMPKKNGLETLDEMRTDEKLKNMPVIMLTNLSGKHDKQNAAKATEYWIKKNAKPETFGENIIEVLKKHKESA